MIRYDLIRYARIGFASTSHASRGFPPTSPPGASARKCPSSASQIPFGSGRSSERKCRHSGSKHFW
eukprot:1503703-Pyramimonas_sp.AAC.2